MERSQSYTSFETTTNGNKNGNYNNLIRTNSNYNNNINDINNYYKNKFPSTSSLNLRKALEMRQTQLQKQQQQQQENLQRQQWRLLYEQRQQQLQQQKQQLLLQQQQHAASSENLLNAPLYLSSLNGLQLLRRRRQKMLQRQNSTTKSSIDDLNFLQTTSKQHIDDNVNNDDDDDDGNNNDTDEDYEVTLRENLRIVNDNNENHNYVDDDDHNDDVHNDNELTLTAANNQITMLLNATTTTPPPLQQKLLQFQRQRPYSEANLNYRATSPLATMNQNQQSQSLASSPITLKLKTSQQHEQQLTTINPTLNNSTIKTTTTTGRRLQHYDQSLSFDSAISNTTTSTNTTTPSTANILNNENDNMSPLSPRHPNFGKLKRDNSIHSDSSRYSSVDSLLESRKPDPEAILINLGFGPIVSEDILSRIPKRFLKPSQVRGIDTDAFVRRLQLANSLADHSVLGYRGLIGNPDLPPSTIVAKIMQRFEVNERKKSMGSIEQTLR